MSSVTSRYLNTLSSNLSLVIVSRANNASTTPSADKVVLNNLYFWVFGVFLCFLSTVGLVTNILNIYALSQTVRVSKRPMYHCLICMAAVDMLLMLLLLTMSTRFYLQRLSNPNDVRKEYTARTINYPSYFLYSVWYIFANVFMTISNWCVVTMGVFRLIAVFAPLKASSLCTMRRVRLTLLFISVFSIIVNLPMAFEQRLKDGRFTANGAITKYNTISVVFSVPIPILSVFVINIILIARIRLYRTQMKKLLEGQNCPKDEESTKLARSNSKISRQGETTLISVSLFTVFMCMPNVIYFISGYTDRAKHLSVIEKNVFYLVATMCIYINHACNFFFYVMLNKPFRRLLWKKVRNGESAAAPSSTLTTSKGLPTRRAAYESIRLTTVSDFSLSHFDLTRRECVATTSGIEFLIPFVARIVDSYDTVSIGDSYDTVSIVDSYDTVSIVDSYDTIQPIGKLASSLRTALAGAGQHPDDYIR
ncbi:probable G-protein coupled receptor 139 [Watersipora subatra]|uniref:probable G-protein coupled receptor 139 n=1 Tax=Watersipora subatra TaxID=2589382 RepID=UPI00355C2F57